MQYSGVAFGRGCIGGLVGCCKRDSLLDGLAVQAQKLGVVSMSRPLVAQVCSSGRDAPLVPASGPVEPSEFIFSPTAKVTEISRTKTP